MRLGTATVLLPLVVCSFDMRAKVMRGSAKKNVPQRGPLVQFSFRILNTYVRGARCWSLSVIRVEIRYVGVDGNLSFTCGSSFAEAEEVTQE